MDRKYKIIALLDKISEWSIYLMILFLPFGKSVVEITIVTALLSLIASRILKREKLISESSHINIFLYIFLAATLLSLVNSAYMGLSVRALFSKSLKFAALFLAAKEIINTREKLTNFIIISVLSCSIILLDGFVQYYVTSIDFLHNYPAFKYMPLEPDAQIFPTSSFPFPNDFAAWMLIFVFPFGIFTFFGNGSWLKRVVSGTIFICLIYSLILTKVRGAWIGFLISLGFLSLFRLKRIFVIVVLLILIGAIFINKALIPDLLSLVSIGDRSVMWKNGWEIFKEHPIIGNGVNTFFVNYARVRDDEHKNKKGSYAHNCYLQMASDIGLIGLLAFLLFISSVIIKGFRALKTVEDPLYRSLIFGIGLGLIAFLVHSAGDTNLYSLNLSALFWLSGSLLLAVVKLGEQR